jgi:nicotinate-nucleotide adenylyltransferase
LSVAARVFSGARVAPGVLAQSPPPAWSFVVMPMVNQSSSAIRARGEWRR